MQAALARIFPKLASYSRRTLSPWIMAVAWSAAGVRAIQWGSWVLIGSRLVRRTEIHSVVREHYPRAIGPRPLPTRVLLTSGRSVTTRASAIEIADFLGVPFHGPHTSSLIDR